MSPALHRQPHTHTPLPLSYIEKQRASNIKGIFQKQDKDKYSCKTGSHYIALGCMEQTMQSRLVLNSEIHQPLLVVKDTDILLQGLARKVHPSSGKLLFATDRDLLKTTMNENAVVQPSPNGYIYNITRTTKAQGSLQKRQDSTRERQFAVKTVSRKSQKLQHKVSSTWLPKHDLNKHNTKRLAKMERESSAGLNPRQRTTSY